MPKFFLLWGALPPFYKLFELIEEEYIRNTNKRPHRKYKNLALKRKMLSETTLK